MLIPNKATRTSLRPATVHVIACLLAATIPASSSVAMGPNTVIKGKIATVDTREPVGGALVKVQGFGKVRTNARGRYVLRTRTPPAGAVNVFIRASGHVRRKTSIMAPGPGGRAKADWNLLPRASDGFDVRLFNSVARPSGVSRWETLPTIRVVSNRLACRGGLLAPDSGSCPDWVGTTSPVSPKLLGWIRSAAAQMRTLASVSGKRPRVVEVQLAPGRSFGREELLAPNVLTLGAVEGDFAAVFPLFDPAQGAIGTRAALFAESGSTDERSVRFRVARGLGFYGRLDETACNSVMGRGLSSFFCDASVAVPSALDEAMGRALYSRAIGNTAPDRDPVE